MAPARDDNPARRIFRRLARLLLSGLLTLTAAAHVHAAENEGARWDRGLFVGNGAPGVFSACLDPGAASTYGLSEPIELAWSGQDWIESKNHAITGAWHVRAGARGAPASMSRTVGTRTAAVPLALRKLYFAKQPVLDCAHWLPGPRDDFLREARATPPLIATSVAAGTRLSCAILDDGTLRCWGDLGSGSVGADNGSSVAVLPVQGVRQLALTVRACALRNDGSIACWGGRTGRGEAEHPALIEAPAKATAISFGSQLCALLVDGSVACAGPQPGLPTHLAAVAGIKGAVSIAAGHYARSCAAMRTGEVACWGRLAPPPVLNEDEDSIRRGVMRIAGVEQAAAVAAGRVQDCALLRTGKVSCWSYDAQSHVLPAAALPLEHVTAVSSGNSLTCALTEAGEVSCWSDPYTNAAGIAKVAGLKDATMLAVGGDHACALLRGGSVRCWGSNTSAQLGSLHDLMQLGLPSDGGMAARVVFGFADGPAH